MSRCGILQEIAELSVGHLRKGLVATYNKDTAWQARVDAFQKVSNHVVGLVSSSGEPSVVALPTLASAS
jgi:hypothetical protein